MQYELELLNGDCHWCIGETDSCLDTFSCGRL